MVQKLRADAQDNRDRIRAAARQLFADHGTDVGMREIARRAGVGPATLYRRFPTRQGLVDDVFADELAACRTIVEHGQEDPDPWQGLRFVITELIVRNAGNHAFVDAIATTSEGTGAVTEHRRQLVAMLHDLTQHAKSRRRLRADFTTDDVILALVAARGLSVMDGSRRGIAARRLAALILDALQPEP
ncbi:TetR/AcrR family transcriptional regulator [Curtobacterium sp. MCLR17_034]|uniref:TetR/AcrR family transcriptional regulator n=1 Tax=Curtobacterium sp. MCLR17_034 TaxID=2175623 RepID=UPI000DA9A9FA|nr:TetR/AcrR family transcriptional regulator [Curtobacterium sp. MCLR17_034]PZF10431.1 TetR/AcrR family transcriptional regulator [Curtobacterium sp. MCLR17_034]